MNSALYVGHVQHHRFRPRVHHLRYRFFWMLLDLDELAEISRRCAVFSHDRFNLFAFHQRDHLAPGGDLRGQIRGLLADAGIKAEGPIRIMCMPRILGHVFNPISLFFCHHAEGQLAAMIYEVNNTFGQRHAYLFAAADAPGDAPMIAHSCAKEFYVSPFMEMRMRYEFKLNLPADHHALKINGYDQEGLLIATGFDGKRQELSDRALLGRFFSHPLLTLKVVAGINLEALRLWLKGARIVRRPPPPEHSVTFVTGSESTRMAPCKP